MDKETFYKKLEDILEVEDITLNGDTVLADVDEWDSLGKLALMAMAKKEWDCTLTANQIREFLVVDDIYNLLQ